MPRKPGKAGKSAEHGFIALAIGGLLASALGNAVRSAAAKSALGSPELLAKVASGLAWAWARAFDIGVAVNQIGIATALVNTLFLAVVGAVALALGRAFDFGGRETASKIVRNWIAKGQQNQDTLSRAVDAAGSEISRKAAPYRAP